MKPNQRLRSLLLAILIGSNILVFVLSGIALLNSRSQYQLRAERLPRMLRKVDQSPSNSINKIDLSCLHLLTN